MGLPPNRQGGRDRSPPEIENFGLLYVDYATQQAHAEAERIVLPGGRRAKPAGVIRSRCPGGRWTGRPYAEECGVASNSGCDHHHDTVPDDRLIYCARCKHAETKVRERTA
jgi:hypothetical protein